MLEWGMMQRLGMVHLVGLAQRNVNGLKLLTFANGLALTMAVQLDVFTAALNKLEE